MQSILATIQLDGLHLTITIHPKHQTIAGLIYMAQFNELSITQYNHA